MRIKFLLLLPFALPLCGCRYKGWESFSSATTPSPPLGQPGNASRLVPGDAYAYGGIAEPTGGLMPKTDYGVGSNPNSTAPVNNRFDQPEYGSGQQPGELPNDAVPGAAQENGPGLQPGPGDVPIGATAEHG